MLKIILKYNFYIQIKYLAAIRKVYYKAMLN